MKFAPTEPEHYLTRKRIVQLSQPYLWLPLVALFSAGAWLQHVQVSWLWAVCAVYLTLPYGFFMQGVLDGLKHNTFRLEFWVVALACNIPFWLYIWTQGPTDMALWLIAVLGIGVLYDLVNVQTKGVPGLDGLAMAFMVTASFVLGVCMSGVGTQTWLPAVFALGLWVMAEYLRLDIYGQLNSLVLRSTTRTLGVDKTLMVCIGLYTAAAVLPVIFYGWPALPIAVLIAVDVVYAIALLPHRARLKTPAAGRLYLAHKRAHYVAASIAAAYLILLQATL